MDHFLLWRSVKTGTRDGKWGDLPLPRLPAALGQAAWTVAYIKQAVRMCSSCQRTLPLAKGWILFPGIVLQGLVSSGTIYSYTGAERQHCLQKPLKLPFGVSAKQRDSSCAGKTYKSITAHSERLWNSALGKIQNTTGHSPMQAAEADLALCRGLGKAISRGASQPQPCCEPVTLWTANCVCLGLTCCSMTDSFHGKMEQK